MEEVRVITREYFKLWKDSGLEGVKPDVFAARASQVGLREPTQTPFAPVISEIRTLPDVKSWLGDCTRCGLCKTRSKIVFGEGNPQAQLMFVGEGPGAEEDAEGLPFVGKAGQLLNKIIEAMGYQREEFYIANVVKCRTPENRLPTPAEIESCAPFLKAQIVTVQPKIIVALGLSAAYSLLRSDSAMSNLRGRFHVYPDNPEIVVMPTYHPAYLLRNPNAKRLVWDDMKFVKAKLESLT